MVSTPSTSLRLELMATGDQSGTWGDTTNTNLGTLLEQAITGVLSVAQGDVATLTLTNTDYVSNQARNAVVNLTGAMTANREVVVPTANKVYLIKNSTTGGFNITVKTAAGTGVEVGPLTSRWVYCDGTNVVDGIPGLSLGYTTTATAAGTTTLTVGSNQQQFFTGVTTQTVVMPVTSTLVLGQRWLIVNNSTGAVTVNSSGGNAIVVLPGGTSTWVTCILLSGTTAASWSLTGEYATKFLAGDGTVALPSLGFASDPDSGWYYIGANNIGAAVNGAKVLDVSTTGLGVTGSVTSSGALLPSANDGAAVGASGTAWADLFLASGGVINFNAGNATLTHSAGLLTSNVTIAATGSSVGFVGFQAISTEAAAAAGPIVELYRNSASAAAADVIGEIDFTGQNSTPAKKTYATIGVRVNDATASSEDATVIIAAMKAGTVTNYLTTGANAAGTATANAVGLPRGQLSFPATQNASSDANTLDDYEEGTWTPTMTFNNSSTGVTYGAQTGYYIKVGKLVTLWGRITLTSNGTGVGTARITGLPFTSDTLSITMPGPMRLIAGGSAATGIYPVVESNATSAVLYIPGATAATAATDTEATNTFSADFTMIYQAAA